MLPVSPEPTSPESEQADQLIRRLEDITRALALILSRTKG